MVSEAIAQDDDGESLNRVFKWLETWAEVHDTDQDEWLRAIWYIVHKSSGGNGSLAFNVFPECLAAQLEDAAAAMPDDIAIVGLKYNDYKDALAQFDGSERLVTFKLAELSGKMRMAAYVGGKMLGVVSSETAIPAQQTAMLSLVHKGQVVYATARA
jgi:hypothetical protein